MITLSRLQQRSRLLQAVRCFFISRGYLEADTPIRLPEPLPEANIKPCPSKGWFLHASPEQCMKRMLAHGSSKLFQMCHCFRQEEVGRYHRGEFTMLEWYHTGWSYIELMAECEEFIRTLAAATDMDGIFDNETLHRQGRRISLAAPWKRLTVEDAFQLYGGMDLHDALAQDIFDEILVSRIEPELGWDVPVFLYDYPAELGSLAKKKENHAEVAERFELYVAGIELANGFSELTDPLEQRERFVAEMRKAEEHGTLYKSLPEKFLVDLENLDETAGIALGIDRLFMILLGCESVADVMCMTPEEL